MRIVTRPDFDGVVCAALLHEAEKISHPTLWVQPGEMQKGMVSINSTDIIANLPYHEKCALWFDHHITNQPEGAFKGAFSLAPSAARVVYEYYEGRFRHDFEPLILQTDAIDSANLTNDQIIHPEQYPHVLLSMTITGHDLKEIPYWEHLVSLLRRLPVEAVVSDPQVSARCKETMQRNTAFKEHLIRLTRLHGHVAVTDFRLIDPTPDGNRFLVYALYPKAFVSVKIRYADPQHLNIKLSVGRNILNDGCRIDVGSMLARFGGGGHAGAGACTFPATDADLYIPEIISILKENKRMKN